MEDLVTADVVSVGDLVRQRLSDDDRWNLALVQRDEVWDQVRMRHLLDSLLAGYPIGAILLCRVRGESKVLRLDGSSRRQEDASPDAWQLLDGQQRINALFSMFTDQGAYGRFYLKMTHKRQAPGPADTRARKDRMLGYIVHRETLSEPVESREQFIDLGRWAEWASSRDELDTLGFDAPSIAQTLQSLDPEFAPELTGVEAENAVVLLRALIDLWTAERIPVLRASVESPLDVLEIFTRINLGGVDVAGSDVYFAGVKTFWSEVGVDAERRLDQVRQCVPLLRSRLHALRVISRLASRGVGGGDLMPLNVERLVGVRGHVLLDTMRELTDENSVALQRMSVFSQWYIENSELRYVLRQVTPELLDDVLAWVAASPATDSESLDRNRGIIDSYLLGATLFSYRSVLGQPFHRLALLEALVAGSRGEPFPAARIVAVAYGKTRLQGSRGRKVLRLDDDRDRAELAQRNGWTLIALAQQIPYSWEVQERFDWDHIIPKAHASKMRIPGKSGRLRHHADRYLINSTGNFWALNFSANRSLGMTAGDAKFDWLREREASPEERFKLWPTSRWSLTEDEIEDFNDVYRRLEQGGDAVEPAMQLFRQTVTNRSRRLLNEVLERFPEVRIFAADGGSEPIDPTEAGRDFRGPLGIEKSARNLRGATADRAHAELHQRASDLSALIREELTSAGRYKDHWVHPSSPKKPGKWIAFELSDRNCIELIARWAEDDGVSLLTKAYAKRHRHGDLYPEFNHIPLGAEFDQPDPEIVAAFLGHLRELDRTHPRS